MASDWLPGVQRRVSLVDWNSATLDFGSAGTWSTGSLDIRGVSYVGIIPPGSWSASNLSFIVSAVGGTLATNWQRLLDINGTELTYALGTTPNYALALADALRPWPYFRLTSGSNASYTVQNAARTFTVLFG
jgi:hypothetical protein